MESIELQNILDSYILRHFSGPAEGSYVLVPLFSNPVRLVKISQQGALIWQCLAQGVAISDVVQVYSEFFAGSKEEIENSISNFVKSISKNPVKKGGALELTKKLEFDMETQYLSCEMELTGKCNLNCIHCYAKNKRAQKDISTKRVLKLIDELADLGVLRIGLTGGEVLARKDFPQIYEHIRRKGLVPTMITNGALMNTEIADLLAKYPPYFVRFSLYGASAKSHEAVTKVKGSFSATVRAINMLKERGISVWLGCLIMSVNADQIGPIKNFAKNLDIPVRFFGNVHPTLEKSQSPLQYSADANTRAEVIEANKISRIQFFPEPIPFKKQPEDTVYPCDAGLKKFVIKSNGDVGVCLADTAQSINITNRTLASAYHELKSVREERLKISPGCNKCPVINNLYCA